MFPFSLFENKKEGLPAESIVVLPANVTNLKIKKKGKRNKSIHTITQDSRDSPEKLFLKSNRGQNCWKRHFIVSA